MSHVLHLEFLRSQELIKRCQIRAGSRTDLFILSTAVSRALFSLVQCPVLLPPMITAASHSRSCRGSVCYTRVTLLETEEIIRSNVQGKGHTFISSHAYIGQQHIIAEHWRSKANNPTQPLVFCTRRPSPPGESENSWAMKDTSWIHIRYMAAMLLADAV